MTPFVCYLCKIVNVPAKDLACSDCLTRWLEPEERDEEKTFALQKLKEMGHEGASYQQMKEYLEKNWKAIDYETSMKIPQRATGDSEYMHGTRTYIEFHDSPPSKLTRAERHAKLEALWRKRIERVVDVLAWFAACVILAIIVVLATVIIFAAALIFGMYWVCRACWRFVMGGGVKSNGLLQDRTPEEIDSAAHLDGPAGNEPRGVRTKTSGPDA